MYSRLILLITLLFSVSFAGNPSNIDAKIHDEEKVDGDYIMHHIQDDRVFEIFNPFDWNDSNKDHYYFTYKLKLERSWNKLENIPFISQFLAWKWDPSTSLSATKSSNQLIKTPNKN